MSQHMQFVGVSTQASSIMRVFPRWAEALGLDASLRGVDLPIDATPQDYRAALTAMRDDPTCEGALITTHKIGMYEAARDLFDELDDFATEVGEVSCVALDSPAQNGGPRKVGGAAKDPITAGLALEEVLAPDHFSRGGHLLCLGAGGAGAAIGWYLAGRDDHPAAMTFVDPDEGRLTHLHEVVTQRAAHTSITTVPLGTVEVDQLVAALPPYSVVVNATGMGKDRPGSPLPAESVLPEHSVVWELNYRGSLDFLHQAQAQSATRDVQVVDGWRYFIHGWTQVIAEVFNVPMDEETVATLAALAEDVRGSQ